MVDTKSFRIVVCMPAYDEEESIRETIKDIKKYMLGYDYDIHVQDDGSTDKTVEIAKDEGACVFKNVRNLGLAKTFLEEMKHVTDYDIVVHTDADGQYPAKFIPEMITKVMEGNDLVLGSRFSQGSSYNEAWLKKIGNKMFARAFTKLLRISLTDTTTGFRAFNKKVASLTLINDFTYTQEQIIRATKEGLRIAEIPITTNKTRKSKLFKNPLEYALKAWINIFRIYRDYNPIKFFGKIGLTFFATGFILGCYIITRVVMTGNTGGIPRVILSAMLMLNGVQILLFGFLSDMWRKS